MSSSIPNVGQKSEREKSVKVSLRTIKIIHTSSNQLHGQHELRTDEVLDLSEALERKSRLPIVGCENGESLAESLLHLEARYRCSGPFVRRRRVGHPDQ